MGIFLGFVVQVAPALEPHQQDGAVHFERIGAGPDRRIPRQGSEIRRRGYQDGLLGALHDVDHRHRPDPNNHREYQEPKVPFEGIEAYRDGYLRGFDDGVREMAGMPESSSQVGGDMALRGYHDGASCALRDWDRHLRADPNNRDEYRNPHVAPESRGAYREAFRHGYSRVASLIYGGSRDH